MRPSRTAAQQGITLIELMITVAIAVLLALMAFPTWTTWLASQQVRAVSESLLNGIRVAQTEAVKRHAQVRFVLDTSVGWEAQLVSDDSVLREEKFKEGGGHVSFTTTPAGTTEVIFDGLGRIFDKDGNPLASRITFDIVSSKISTGVRPQRVVIDTAAATGAGIRSCDPKLASTDPRACPT
jgi:type IV fimbrial biogenesis protein FimT